MKLELGNGHGRAGKERKALTLKERLEICQATERQRLTFCKVGPLYLAFLLDRFQAEKRSEMQTALYQPRLGVLCQSGCCSAQTSVPQYLREVFAT